MSKTRHFELTASDLLTILRDATPGERKDLIDAFKAAQAGGPNPPGFGKLLEDFFWQKYQGPEPVDIGPAVRKVAELLEDSAKMATPEHVKALSGALSGLRALIRPEDDLSRFTGPLVVLERHLTAYDPKSLKWVSRYGKLVRNAQGVVEVNNPV